MSNQSLNPNQQSSRSQGFSSDSLHVPSDESRPDSALSLGVRQQVRTLVTAFSRRSDGVRSVIERPPTPDETELPEDVDIDPETLKVETYVPDLELLLPPEPEPDEKATRWEKFVQVTISTRSKMYFAWLWIISAAFVYNAFSVPFRASYPYMTPSNLWAWLLADYICDVVYLIDMTVVKPKVRFMRGGIEVTEFAETRKNYLMRSGFKMDLVSMIPFDILYGFPALRFNTLLRLNRILRYRVYYELLQHLDSMVPNPYVLRIGQTLTNMLFLIHCNSCLYYSFSEWQSPFQENKWIYAIGAKGSNDYVRCFYYATKLAISIGNNPQPTNLYEHVYALIAWMNGVFVFAILLGNIRDIVATATKTKDYYRNSMDACLDHLKQLKVSPNTLEKVRLWYVRTWEQQGTLDEGELIAKLPKKLQTDLAISVHYKTLGKVKLFQGCDQALIRDLVLKLKPILFLPGDFVCRKGEVGREMYIISYGMVEVVGGPNRSIVFVTLKAGSVFGEISLLAESGKNRRTADVRSKGFSFLFVLSKQDLDDTIRDYPESQALLRKKARKLMKENEKRDKAQEENKDKLQEAVSLKMGPKMVETVIQVLNQDGNTVKTLKERLEKTE